MLRMRSERSLMLMGDTLPTNSAAQPQKKVKHLKRLHPYWGGQNEEDPTENQESSSQMLSQTDDIENSLTISTQGRQTVLESEGYCHSISNTNYQSQLPHLESSKSLEIQALVHEFSTLLNDSIRIAETAYSVCLLETQIGVLIQAQKIAKVITFLMMLI
jgi:hypothetical protein